MLGIQLELVVYPDFFFSPTFQHRSINHILREEAPSCGKSSYPPFAAIPGWVAAEKTEESWRAEKRDRAEPGALYPRRFAPARNL